MRINSWNPVRSLGRSVACGIMALALFAYHSKAADIAADSLKIAPGVVVDSGYETPATSYIVANSTNIYSDHAVYGGKVTGELKRGEKVEALAKVKGWEWLLVGRQGIGIGYVPISMLAPEDKYIP
jgi:hypothetical protein